MKGKKKRSWSSNRLKAVALSIEMLLLISAVIALSVSAFYSVSRLVLSQAESAKQTLTIVKAEAWDIGSGISVTVYVQNTGSQPVTIKYAGVDYTQYQYVYRCYISDDSFTDVIVRPGEAKVISFALAPYSGGTVTFEGECDELDSINPGDAIHVFLVLSDNSEVGTAVKVLSP